MIQIDKSKIEKLAKKYRLSLVILFGSQATGKTHPKSDVDLAFIPGKRMGLMETAQMQFEFSQKLKIKNLELVNLKNAGVPLLKQAAQKSALLYQKETSTFALFKIYALKLFMESKKLLSLRELSLSKFLQKA